MSDQHNLHSTSTNDLLWRLNRLLEKRASVEAELRRRGELPESNKKTESKHKTNVLEYRPFRDGLLQLEEHIYVGKDGNETTHAYWYYRYKRDGKARALYIGKTDHPEDKTSEKLAEKGD